jgi:hypothetical protein
MVKKYTAPYQSSCYVSRSGFALFNPKITALKDGAKNTQNHRPYGRCYNVPGLCPWDIGTQITVILQIHTDTPYFARYFTCSIDLTISTLKQAEKRGLLRYARNYRCYINKAPRTGVNRAGMN